MTTKMENARVFVVKTCQVKCLNVLDFVNKLQERYTVTNDIYIFYMLDIKKL